MDYKIHDYISKFQLNKILENIHQINTVTETEKTFSI